MTEDFNKWWDSDELDEDNPYELESALFWAWEGWQAAVKAEREWQGLTDDEIMDACAAVWASHPIDVGRIIEAKLKEKNT